MATEDLRSAAAVLVKHLFSPRAAKARGVEYAVQYRLSDGNIGGDVVDVYAFDNGSCMFSVTDISGKGERAAVHAAMVKYALRAYASEAFTPEKVMVALDRLYTENAAFEADESFATCFLAIADEQRQALVYASAAHDAAFLLPAESDPVQLPVTAPLIGVFAPQRHLFHQRFIPLGAGTVLLVVSDGITEARRDPRGSDFYGSERLLNLLDNHREATMETLARTVIDDVRRFTGDRVHDDMAVLAVRFLT